MVIEFYVPDRHISKQKYVPLALRGKVLPFVKGKEIKLFIRGRTIVVAVCTNN